MIQSIFSFLRRGLQVRRNFSTTCTTLGTRGEKLQVDAALCGRSMVEMLGVLAIIGILSVGAIAGYSKAMMKYKLNIASDEITQLIHTIYAYSDKFKGIPDNKLIFYFEKLNLIPNHMKVNNVNIIEDIFGNNIDISVTSEKEILFTLSTKNQTQPSVNIKLCQIILENLKTYYLSLRNVTLQNNNIGTITYCGSHCQGYEHITNINSFMNDCEATVNQPQKKRFYLAARFYKDQ